MGNGYSVDPPAAKTAVSFELNGVEVVVRDASPLVTLNEWLRSQPGLKGTKRMCTEGGCGCCVVAASPSTEKIVQTDQSPTIAINSVSSYKWLRSQLL